MFFSSLLYYCDLFVGSMPGGAFAQVSALLLPQRNTFLQRVRGKYISGLYKKNVGIEYTYMCYTYMIKTNTIEADHFEFVGVVKFIVFCFLYD